MKRPWKNLVPYVSEQAQPSLRRAVLAWLMRVANAHPFGLWYSFKAILLEFYGVPDGYSLQRVEAPCWGCGGTGGKHGDCWDCGGDGVHHITRMVLARTSVEGWIFHTPHRKLYSDAELWALRDKAKAYLPGLAQHRPTPPEFAQEALCWILLLTGQWHGLKLAFMRHHVVMPYRGSWYLPFGILRNIVAAVRSIPTQLHRLKWAIKNRNNDIPF